jgi:class 3 adenylate cyclase/tetratricopeptide (TPR) repeat protein
MPVAPQEPEEVAGIGRRRYLTVLFTDLSDSTQLGELLQAEHYAAMLGALRALCRQIVPHHGGRIARLQGDGMLAIFGFPEPREDDGRRAIEAALDLHQAIGRVTVQGSVVRVGTLGLHSGVHAGLVFVSDGDVERGRFELLGSVPNIAFRLSDAARRNEIIVSEETLGPQAYFFSLGEREWVTPRGRRQALPVYRILGRSALQRRYEARCQRGLATFVGREAELRSLQAALGRAANGAPACIAVRGGPGVGKSRLIEEFVRLPELKGWRVLMGHCESYLGAQPLQPFLQMLRGLLGLPPSAPGSALAVAPALDALAALGDDGRRAREALSAALSWVQPSAGRQAPAGGAIAALGEVFDACAGLQPLLLVIDDWQWADEASMKALSAMRALARPILVLLALRSDGETSLDGDLTVLELAPLGLHETQQAMRQWLPGADPFLVARIHQHAGGNPLFIEELCHVVQDATAQHASEPSFGGTAAWLSALIASRVARLPAEQHELVQAAAVIGNAFPAWLLERLCNVAASDTPVRRLAEQDLLFPAEQPGWLRFKHGITREVVYESIAFDQRTALHRRVAQALNPPGGTPAEEFYESLAYHCGSGALHEDAARFAELAGDKAAAAAALDRARAQYAAALKALDALEPAATADCLRWCGVAGKLGMACVFDPLALGDGLGVFERGVALARATGSAHAMARAEYWMGYLLYARGVARSSRSHCEAALALAAQAGDERLAAQVRATLGEVLHAAGDYAAALPLLDSAIDSKRRQSHPGSRVAVGSAYALACKGALLGDQGRFDLADECFAESLQLLGDGLHQVASSVRNWISCTWQWQGRWEEAAEMADTSAQIAEQVHSRQLLAMSRALRSHARWALHGREEDLQVMRQAISWIEARRGGLVTSLNYGQLVEACASLGLEADMRRHAARLFLRVRQRDLLGAAQGCRALARAAAQTGPPGTALRYLVLAERFAAVRGSPHEQAKNLLARAQLAPAGRQDKQARELAQAAAEAFRRLGMPAYSVLAERAWDADRFGSPPA